MIEFACSGDSGDTKCWIENEVVKLTFKLLSGFRWQEVDESLLRFADANLPVLLGT